MINHDPDDRPEDIMEAQLTGVKFTRAMRVFIAIGGLMTTIYLVKSATGLEADMKAFVTPAIIFIGVVVPAIVGIIFLIKRAL